MYRHIKMSRGFTLIETVVYIALLGMIMTSVLLSVYSLIESTQKDSGKAGAQVEGVFVTRKIGWALADMSAAPTVGGSGCTQTVSITKGGYTNNPIEFRRNTTSNTIEMSEGGVGVYVPITTANVSATCLKFTSIPAVGLVPAGITATTTLSGFDFVNTRYVRK